MTTAHDPWEDWDAEDTCGRDVLTFCAIMMLLCNAAALLATMMGGHVLLFTVSLGLYPWSIWTLHLSARCET